MSENRGRPDPLIVTSGAAQRIKTVLAKENRPNGRLRVSVSGGGCSGFQYDFALDDREEAGDVLVQREGATVVIDAMSLMYVLGAELDFVEDLTGSYFRVRNPNATASCGCGNSFAL
jgi:iron-sulfur cluster insertion protein